MARSTAEIQADIAMTRGAIEAHLDALRARIPNRWWIPYAVVGGALVAGVALSRVPVLRVLNTGARVVQTAMAVAGAVAAAQQFLSGPTRPRGAPTSNGSVGR
jgi:hypothetical protein